MRAVSALAPIALIASLTCKSSPSAPPIAQHAAPTSPPPSFDWRDGIFALSGVPAISEDGSILRAIIDRDGDRGNANLRFVLQAPSNAEIEQHEVLAVADGDAMFGPDGPTEELRARIAKGNRWLADTHARLRLVPLRALTITASEIVTGARATVGDVTLRMTPTRWWYERGNHRVALRQVRVRWAPSTRGGCTHEPVLSEAWIDIERRVAVLTIGFVSKTCDALSPFTQVVRW